jgi:Spy/CpxP family protein refolding chaperone
MRLTRTTTYALATLLLGACAHAPAPVATQSPYVGQQTRGIKALSDAEVDGYLKGEGMGMARAAELNHLPGPRHVLMLVRELGLTDAQRQETERLFDTMHAKAVAAGEQYVAAERELDAFFAHGGDLTRGTFAELVARAARLQGEVRAAHLEAHLAMVKVLTSEQIASYDRLRGYASASN